MNSEREIENIVSGIITALQDKDYDDKTKRYIVSEALKNVSIETDKAIKKKPSKKNDINYVGSIVMRKIIEAAKANGVDVFQT
jgi:hypothetical protein